VASYEAHSCRTLQNMAGACKSDCLAPLSCAALADITNTCGNDNVPDMKSAAGVGAESTDGAGYAVGKRKRIRTAAAEMSDEQKKQRKTSSSRRTAGG